MPAQDQLRFRAAERGDAAAVAALHAASWQRHYRGAFSDAFLDGEVAGFLRLARPRHAAKTDSDSEALQRAGARLPARP